MKRMCLIVLAIATVGWAAGPTPETLRARFAAAMRPVDRVVISAGRFGAEGPDLRVRFDRTDREAIGGLVDLFEPTEIDGYCMCLGDTLVEFFAGEEYVFSFTVHHNALLRADGVPWSGDLQFEPAAIERFLRGFQRIGYAGFADELDAAQAQDRVADADWARFLAIFPPAARPFVPRGLATEERFGANPRTMELRAALGRSASTALTLWHARGELSRQAGTVRLQSLFQPFASLLDGLAQLPPEVQMEAMEQVRRSEDPLARAGAGLFLLFDRSGVKSWTAPVEGALLATLANDVFGLVRTRWDESGVVQALLQDGGPAVIDVLLQRLANLPELVRDETRPDGAPESDPDDSRTMRFVNLTFNLVASGYPAVLPVLERLQAAYPTGVERLALEVGIATLDPARSALVQAPHLRCEWFMVRDAAVEVIKREGRTLPLALLVELARETISADDAVEEIEFESRGSAQSWAQARLAELGVTARPKLKATDSDARVTAATEDLEAGRYEQAHGRFQRLTYTPKRPLNGLKAMLGSGRVGAAVQACDVLISAPCRGAPNADALAELLLFRAATYYANGWYLPAAEDFGAATRVGRSNLEWAMAMEYLARAHLGRAGEAMLKDWSPFDPDGSGPSLDWPDAALRYLKGEIDAAALLEAAGTNRVKRFPSDIRHLSQAHWLLAEQARLAGDEAAERAQLTEVLALADFTDEVHLLARLRERDLRWGWSVRADD